MRRALALAAAVACMVSVQVISTVAPAAAYPSDTVVISGHGFGHGRGMGQFGALGYALQGQSYTQILQHYYSNTTAGGIDPNTGISVQLVAADSKDAIVYQPSQAPSVNGAAIPANAVLVRETAPGSNVFSLFYGGGCSGPWPSSPSATVNGTVTITPNGAGPDPSTMLHTCLPNGETAYEGTIQVLDGDGAQRAVNVLPMEVYLRGVVPRESPSSWGSLGGGAGEEALKAQAVAARSYSMAENRHPWAKTCDTTSCQVYGGRWKDGTNLYGTAEYANSDNAVASTSSQVRMLNNAVARTEFSSSTGGFTAGGTFPAVVDDGDAVCVNSAACNNNHDWTANVPVSAIQGAYPQIGTLQSLHVSARTAADGGRRAQTVRIDGTSSSVDVAAATFQSQFGLKSTWFDFVNSPSGGVSGYWLVARDGGIFTFGGASFFGSTGNMKLNRPVLGMASAPGGAGYWLVASDGGIFSFGDAQFFGSTGNIHLNKPVVAMAPTPTGHGYWLVASDGGIFNFGDAQFYGSTGGTKLNAPIIGMGAASAGGGYWLVGSDGGIFSFGNAPFLGSLPGSGVKEEATWVAATPTGGGYLISTAAGHVFSYGDAPNFGDMRQAVKNYTGRVIGIAVSPTS